MTVKELKDILSKYDDSLEIVLSEENATIGKLYVKNNILNISTENAPIFSETYNTQQIIRKEAEARGLTGRFLPL